MCGAQPCMGHSHVYEVSLYRDITLNGTQRGVGHRPVRDTALYGTPPCMGQPCIGHSPVWNTALYRTQSCMGHSLVWDTALYGTQPCTGYGHVWDSPIWDTALYDCMTTALYGT